MSRAPITTHILDTERGKTAANVDVQLHILKGDQWEKLSQAATNSDGRIEQWLQPFELSTGLYQLTFNITDYFQRLGVKSFYPQVVIAFSVDATDEHYHVPLLLSAHGYSTYRGS